MKMWQAMLISLVLCICFGFLWWISVEKTFDAIKKAGGLKTIIQPLWEGESNE